MLHRASFLVFFIGGATGCVKPDPRSDTGAPSGVDSAPAVPTPGDSDGDTAAGDTAAGDTAAGDTAAGDTADPEAPAPTWGDPLPGWTAGATPDGLEVAGWTWHNPLPQGLDLYGGWAASSGDAWLTGAAGTLIHMDGDSFSLIETGLAVDLLSAHGTANDDVWVVGEDGAALHFNGWTWTSGSTGTEATLTDVFAAERWGTAWAVSHAGEVLRTDGFFSWSLATTGAGPLHAVWGSGDAVWAVGAEVLRADGATWTTETVGDATADGAIWHDVWGSGPDDVWLVGERWPEVASFTPYLAVWRWDGADWTDLSPAEVVVDPADWGRPAAIWVSPAGVVHVANDTTQMQLQGNTWRAAEAAPAPVTAIFGLDDDASWSVGEAGFTGRWDGGAYTELSHGTRENFNGLGGPTADALVAAGDYSAAHHWDGATWSTQLTHVGESHWDGYAKWLNAVWPDDDGLWAVGYGTILRHDGDAWTEALHGGNHWGIWGAAPDDAWTVGPESMYHWDGSSWADLSADWAGITLRDVGGSASDAAWMVGDSGRIFAWDGAAWTERESPTEQYLHRVAAVSADAAWAVGNDVVLRWDGAGWREETLPGDTYRYWRGLSAPTEDDVWVVGDAHALYWDGAAWTAPAMPGDLSLTAVRADPTGGVWIAGRHGQLLHRR